MHMRTRPRAPPRRAGAAPARGPAPCGTAETAAPPTGGGATPRGAAGRRAQPRDVLDEGKTTWPCMPHHNQNYEKHIRTRTGST